MKHYSIQMAGNFVNQKLPELPVFDATRDHARLVWLVDGTLWYGAEAKWINLTPDLDLIEIEDFYSDLLRTTIFLNASYDGFANENLVDITNMTFLKSEKKYTYTPSNILVSKNLYDPASGIDFANYVMVYVDYKAEVINPLTDIDPTIQVSTNGGTNWTIVGNGSFVRLPDNIVGNDIRLRFVAGNTPGEIFHWGLLYNKDLTAACTKYGLTYRRFEAHQGQTFFEADYWPGSLQIFVNGILIDETRYIAENGTDITLLDPLIDGDVVYILSYSTSVRNSDDFIRHDGTVSFSQDQSFGMQRIIDLGNGIDLNDGVNVGQLNLKADIHSPILTGVPRSTTAANADNSTQIATTAFVKNQNYQPNLGYTPEDLANKNQPNGYAGLVGGKISTSQLPALAITNTFVVASQAAMLAITCETGDVAVRTDLSKSYILQGTNPATLSHWQELLTPLDSVLSVNGYTGVVVLNKADVGLGNVDNTSDINKPISTATQTALDLKTDKNIIKNGFFDDGLNYWISGGISGGVIGVTGGRLRLTPPSTAPSYMNSFQPFFTDEGESYILSFDVWPHTSGGSAQVSLSLAGGSTSNNSYTTPGRYKIPFTATTSAQIELRAVSPLGFTYYSEFDNIRVDRVAGVSSVAGKTGNVTLVKADVGLGNVDNTSDINKPISTATQTALDGKADKNLVINGAFDTNTDGWSPIVSGAISSVSGELRIMNSTFNTPHAEQVLNNMIVGQSYYIEYYTRQGSVSVTGVQLYNGDGTFTSGSPEPNGWEMIHSGEGTYGNTFVANSTTVRLRLFARATPPQALGYFDNVVVRGTSSTAGVLSVNGMSGVVVLNKADVGLGNVDNTSDINKPISTATQTALNLKANLASPALTGAPTAPTAAVGTNTTQIATTAYVKSNFVSPALTGTPTSTTPDLSDSSTRIATTQFVKSFISTADNLVENGNFSNALIGWTPNGSAILANFNSDCRVTLNTGSNAEAYQTVNGLIVGETYSLTYSLDTGTAGTAQITYTLGGGGWPISPITTTHSINGSYKINFVAIHTSTTIYFGPVTTTPGQYAIFDNISLVRSAGVAVVNTENGITGGPITGVGTVGLTGQASSFHNLATNGIVTKTATNTIVTRNIVSGGGGITVNNGGGTTGNPTIFNTDRGSHQLTYKYLEVPGQQTLVAEIAGDTLQVIPGSNISIITDPLGNGLTISSTAVSVSWSVISSNITATKGSGYFVNTTGGAVTVNLPSTASIGDVVVVSDYSGNWGLTSCIVGRNGHNIMGLAQNLFCNIAYKTVILTYVNVTRGWNITNL